MDRDDDYKSSDEPTPDMTASGEHSPGDLGQEQPQGGEEESQPMRPRFVFPPNATELWQVGGMLSDAINGLMDDNDALRDELAALRAQLVAQDAKYKARLSALGELVTELAERVHNSLRFEASQRSQLDLRLRNAETPLGVDALRELQMEKLLDVFDKAGILASSFDPDLLAQMLASTHRHITD
jgi:hypothetical protein